MKGIVFTLDALFALIVAIASISIMLYFFYIPQVSYSFRYGEASSILSQLENTNISQLSNSSLLAAQTYYLSNPAYLLPWPQLGGNSANNGGAPFGPAYPFVSFEFSAPSNIQTGIVSDYGNIYFGSGSYIYALNATTGLIAWSRNVQTPVQTTPAIYSGMLIYANATNITALNVGNGNTVWSANIIAIAGSQVQLGTPIFIYNSKIIFGANNYYAYALYPNNGAVAWSINIGQEPTSFTGLSGSIAFKTASNYIGTIVASSSLANLLYPIKPLSSVSTLASLGDIFYYGVSNYANASYINGTKLFGVSAGSAVQGVDIYDNVVLYQGTSSMLALTPSGSVLWSSPMSFGPAPSNARPVVGGNIVYSVWAGNLTAQNLKNGNILWYYQLPSFTFSPYLALAYGKLFAITGNKVIAFGGCNMPNLNANTSLLYTIASMYVNNQTGCAEALASSIYPIYNYSIMVSGMGMNSSSTKSATYYGNNYGYIANPSLDTPSYSWSFWIYPYAWYPNNGIMGQQALGSGYPYIYQSSNTSSNYVLIFTNNMSAPNSRVGTTLELNRWYHIVAVYDQINDMLSLFVNGNLVSSIKQKVPIPRGTSPFYIGYLPMGSLTFNGLIANLQIYNFSLNSQQAGLLYLEGPGGSPISKGIVAWYPDGCIDDVYSLNNTGYIPASCQSLLNPAPLSQKFYNSHVVSKVGVPIPIYNWYLHSSYIYNVSVVSWS
ncbi:MAG: LamG-like jellyroll fold domain-containing protein [Candidatus Micrarchaeia archaeon]